MKYIVYLKDAAGFVIQEDGAENLKDAKARGKYWLTDEYARRIGTDHETLGTYRADVRDIHGQCVWDAFK